HVDDERLDEHEAQEQVAPDVARGARIARDGLDGRAHGLPLRDRAEGCGERERETGRDDRPLDERGARAGGRPRFLCVNGRDESQRREDEGGGDNGPCAHVGMPPKERFGERGSQWASPWSWCSTATAPPR